MNSPLQKMERDSSLAKGARRWGVGPLFASRRTSSGKFWMRRACAGKSRVAPPGMTAGAGGLMSELKLRPPKECASASPWLEPASAKNSSATPQAVAPLTESQGLPP